jgi:hypothetical protein
MRVLTWGLLLIAAIPLYKAWQASRRTSLFQTIHWGIAAWAAWLYVMDPFSAQPPSPVAAYLGLCLLGCTAVAVLGARWPGAHAWNFVMLGLVAVLLLPLLEGAARHGGLTVGTPRQVFLAALIAVGILNYLPTRLAPAALAIAVAVAGEFYQMGSAPGEAAVENVVSLTRLGFPAALWTGFLQIRFRPPAPSQFDLLWLDFRDRFGMFWSQRLREQFNRSAENAGWPVILRWVGLRLKGPMPSADVQTQIVAVLRSLLKRFIAAPVRAKTE